MLSRNPSTMMPQWDVITLLYYHVSTTFNMALLATSTTVLLPFYDITNTLY